MTETGHFTTISTDRAPAPAGHYAQATIAGDQLYIAGSCRSGRMAHPCRMRASKRRRSR